jgi:hypothetical protein
MVVNNEFESLEKEAVVTKVEELHRNLPSKIDELTKTLIQDFLTLT